ncbi:MAG: LacI family transcriptional regulator [Saprospiraceae bacterium]|jgi:LacI family transcriptional regulator
MADPIDEANGQAIIWVPIPKKSINDEMKKRVRIKDVALMAGVSTGTVDRVIHDRGNVAPEVRNKVLKVMEELGFERNLIASALAMNQTFRIVVLLPEPSADPYWKQPYEGMEAARKQVQHYGIQVEYHFFELLSPEDFLEKAKAILFNPPDGILFPPIFVQEGKWLLKECEAKGIAPIIFNTNISEATKLSYIGQDSYQSGVLAARLLSFGLNKNETVLILNLSKGSTNAIHLVDKAQGFRHYFEQHTKKEIKILTLEFEHFNDEEKLSSFLRNLIMENPNLSSIFFTNSRAHLAIECLEESVVNRIKIVGFDLVEQNLKMLQQDKINFLINQNPKQQGYLGIISLYQHFIVKTKIPALQYLPLDIIVKENVQYYQNQKNVPSDILT